MTNQDRDSRSVANDAYLAWKDWDDDRFGELRPEQRYYFEAEVGRTQIDSETALRVLEIGFGNGSFLSYARSKGWQIVGMETNELLVERAKRAGFDAVCADHLASFPQSTFDLVVAFDVIEHMTQPYLINFLADVRRILKDRGVFLARFPNGDSPFGLVNQNGDATHVIAIGSGKAQHLAMQTDFEPIFIGGEALPFYSGWTMHTAHTFVTLPIKKLLELLVRVMFHPRSRIAFCSPNLTMILRRSGG